MLISHCTIISPGKVLKHNHLFVVAAAVVVVAAAAAVAGSLLFKLETVASHKPQQSHFSNKSRGDGSL